MALTLHVPDPGWEEWLASHPLPGAALFGSRTMAETLGLLTLHPGRPFGARDVVFHLGTNLESTQRALDRLRHTGVLTDTRTGRRRDFVLRRGAACMSLRQLALGTVTLGPRLERAHAELGDGALVAGFVHGSVATGTEGPESDVDAVVIGEVGTPELAPYLADLEHLMGRPLNALAFAPDAYRTGVGAPAGFLRRIVDRPRLLIGVGDAWLSQTERDAQRAA